MAVLISPSNNSGWGLGVKGMYGGAKRRSANAPILVKRHYRARWGAVNGRRAATKADLLLDDTINRVVRSARRYYRRHRKPRLLPRSDIAFLTTRARRGPRIRRTRRI